MQYTITHRHEGYPTGNAGHDDWRLQRVKALTDQLKHVLEHNDNMFDDETIRRQMAMLERWLDYCSRDLVDMHTFSKTSAALICDLHNRLKLAADELLRLDTEGGAPVSKEQAKRTDTLLEAVRRSEKLLSNIEALLQ